MNRPQKNKINNPTLPEEHQNLVDERNLVDVHESEEISVEDRISMYWMENKSFISSCIFVLALFIISFKEIPTLVLKNSRLKNLNITNLSFNKCHFLSGL